MLFTFRIWLKEAKSSSSVQDEDDDGIDAQMVWSPRGVETTMVFRAVAACRRFCDALEKGDWAAEVERLASWSGWSRLVRPPQSQPRCGGVRTEWAVHSFRSCASHKTTTTLASAMSSDLMFYDAREEDEVALFMHPAQDENKRVES
ncbi:hypothetical protein C0J52_21120 [Blattella germanica]|nr:hypothetical protein C0J52_21120 [Blattella germanica]